MDHKIRTVGVVGAGEMGHGIAQVCAMHGFDVRVCDVSSDAIGLAAMKVRSSLTKLGEKGKLADSVASILRDRMSWTLDLKDLADCDLIIEAATEKSEVKIAIFKELDKVCPGGTIFATNTSTIPVYWIAGSFGTSRRQKLMGIHFMNPPVLHKRLELIASRYTSKRAYGRAKAFVEAIGRDPIMESQDETGFIINFMLFPTINRAAELVERGERLEDVNALVIGVDKAMPVLDVADFIGLDTVLHGLHILQKYRYEWLRPSALLVRMVEQGRLGRKTGEGFFKYDERGRKI